MNNEFEFMDATKAKKLSIWSNLPNIIKSYGEDIEEIELCGLCTDICVIAHAMVLKTVFPETKIIVDYGKTMLYHQ